MSGIETAAIVAGVIGTGLSAYGSYRQGQYQQAAYDAEAASRERQANDERAASQREAIRRSREARMVLSRQQAVAAASGGGATDATVLDLMGDTAQEGWYQSATALFEGDARARGQLDQAAIARMKGRQAKLAGMIDAGTTILDGVSKWAKFQPSGGGGMPSYYDPYAKSTAWG